MLHFNIRDFNHGVCRYFIAKGNGGSGGERAVQRVINPAIDNS
jgi:hypothetical protein